MICSSVNRDRFIVRLLPGDGLYLELDEIPGLRSEEIGRELHQDRGFGFRIRNSVAEKKLLDNWQDVLRWWFSLKISSKPEPTELRNWHRFVQDNFDYRMGVAIGAVVADAWSEGAGDPFHTPTLSEWKSITGMPWIAFWARELLRWGTLDPFVAFALAQGIANTRKEAKKKRPEFEAWLEEQYVEALAENLIDPQHFLDWYRAVQPKKKRKRYGPLKAKLTGKREARKREEYSVLPIQNDKRIVWIDPAGYRLARTEVDENFLTKHPEEVHFTLKVNDDPTIVRSFVPRRVKL